MSANNWAVCPACLARVEAEKEGQRAATAEAYGKVPVEEFDALRSEASKPIDRERLRTFREDWEIGVDEDSVIVSYTGACSVCGLCCNIKNEEHSLTLMNGQVWPGA